MLRPPPQRFVSFAPQVMIVDYELGKPSRYVYCPRWLLLLLQLECCACCRRKCVALTLPNAWLAWIMDLINCSSCSSTPAAAAAEHAPLIDWCACHRSSSGSTSCSRSAAAPCAARSFLLLSSAGHCCADTLSCSVCKLLARQNGPENVAQAQRQVQEG